MTIKYRAGYKYQLAEDYAVKVPLCPARAAVTDYLCLTPDGLLTIRAGYAWDGPSGPTVDTPSAMRGSLVHDALYQLIRLRLLPLHDKDTADEEYRCLLEESANTIAKTVPGWRRGAYLMLAKTRAWLHFEALRFFGGSAADPTSERPILTAP